MEFAVPEGEARASVLDDRLVIRLGVDIDEVIQRERWLWSGEAMPGQARQKEIEGIKIAEEDAIAAGEAALRAMGLTGFSVTSSETARVVRGSEVVRKGYYLAYLRNPGGYLLVNYTICSDFMLRMQGEEPAYAATQGIERITMFVDEKGVQCFQWSCPFEVKGQPAEQVEILPFERMQEIILQTLYNCLAWNGGGAGGGPVCHPERRGERVHRAPRGAGVGQRRAAGRRGGGGVERACLVRGVCRRDQLSGWRSDHHARL